MTGGPANPWRDIARYPGHALLAGSGGTACAVRAGMALGLGPATDPDTLLAFARAERRVPAWVAPGDRLEARLRDRGWVGIPVGAVARLPLPTFDPARTDLRNLRQSAARARRAGVTLRHLDPPHGTARLRALETVARTWQEPLGAGERRLGSGWWHPTTVARFPAALALDRQGRPAAFVTLLTGYSDREAGLDLMRRRPDAPAGTMDLLLTEVASRLRDAGRTHLDLGLAPLARQRPWWLDHLYRNHRRFYRFGGLYRFKQKLQPQWEPCSLLAPNRAGIALVLAHAVADGLRPPGPRPRATEEHPVGLEPRPV